MTDQKKPLICKIGIHDYYLDRAVFAKSMVCNRCHHPVSQRFADRLAFERAKWREFKGDPDALAKVDRAVAHFAFRQLEESARKRANRHSLLSRLKRG